MEDQPVKRKRGRPRKPINASQVEKLAKIGCPQEEIASVLGCSVDTLSRNFADSIKRGHDNLKMSLRRQQLKLVMAGNFTMAIWLGKQLLGQREPVYREPTEDLEKAIEERLGELKKQAVQEAIQQIKANPDLLLDSDPGLLNSQAEN